MGGCFAGRLLPGEFYLPSTISCTALVPLLDVHKNTFFYVSSLASVVNCLSDVQEVAKFMKNPEK